MLKQNGFHFIVLYAKNKNNKPKGKRCFLIMYLSCSHLFLFGLLLLLFLLRLLFLFILLLLLLNKLMVNLSNTCINKGKAKKKKLFKYFLYSGFSHFFFLLLSFSLFDLILLSCRFEWKFLFFSPKFEVLSICHSFNVTVYT